MDTTKYKKIFPHITAAIQLTTNGRHHKICLHQLQTPESIEQGCNSSVMDSNFGVGDNREKYKEMLLDAAETVLSIFGFSRELYGKPKDKKWWMQLRRNRMNDVQPKLV